MTPLRAKKMYAAITLKFVLAYLDILTELRLINHGLKTKEDSSFGALFAISIKTNWKLRT